MMEKPRHDPAARQRRPTVYMDVPGRFRGLNLSLTDFVERQKLHLPIKSPIFTN